MIHVVYIVLTRTLKGMQVEKDFFNRTIWFFIYHNNLSEIKRTQQALSITPVGVEEI